ARVPHRRLSATAATRPLGQSSAALSQSPIKASQPARSRRHLRLCGSLATGKPLQARIVSRRHAPHAAAPVFAPFCSAAQACFEMRTQYGADKGEHGGIGSGGLAAHEKRLVTEEIRDRVDRPRAKSENLVGRMPAETLAVKRGPQLAADHCGHDWPDRR